MLKCRSHEVENSKKTFLGSILSGGFKRGEDSTKASVGDDVDLKMLVDSSTTDRQYKRKTKSKVNRAIILVRTLLLSEKPWFG